MQYLQDRDQTGTPIMSDRSSSLMFLLNWLNAIVEEIFEDPPESWEGSDDYSVRKTKRAPLPSVPL